jgi:Bifunctional DNA primase/polymerase, N-terminal
MTALAIALDYAAKGWLVFPCRPGSKTPATRRGFKDATTNPATIRRWWLANPDYNIGIATGVASGIWILDIDGTTGVATLHDLESRYGPLPATLCSITGRGRHLWFKADSPIQSSAGRVGDGLDVRGEGGYVLAPPSIHPDGPTYRWDNDLPPALTPGWLLELARRRAIVTISERALATLPPRPATAGVYGQAALDAEIAALASAVPGTRNHALNRASFSLYQLVAGGELAAGDVRARLIDAAHANGLMSDPADGPVSVNKTIASGARAGLQHPRTRRGAA